jgi:hypothetical protein
VTGWLAGTVPLLVVNIASYENLLDQQESALAGAVALLAGIALGGIAAGYFGARARRGDGGTTGAGMAGGLAAVLYVATLLGLMIGSSRLEIAPALITVHPIRVSLAIVCLAAVLLLIALGVGALVGKNASSASEVAHNAHAGQPYAAVGARGMPPHGQAARPSTPAPGYPRGAYTSAATSPAHDGHGYDARGYDGRPHPHPAGPYRPASPSAPSGPRRASDSRPDPRTRPPSGPAPRSAPMLPPVRRDPPRR